MERARWAGRRACAPVRPKAPSARGSGRPGPSARHRTRAAHTALLALLSAAFLALGAGSASAMLVHLEDGRTLSYLAPRGAAAPVPLDAFFSNLDYNGGPVMTSNTNYPVYWQPAKAPAYPAGYQAGIDRYFEDLAHDSGLSTNVDSVAAQYNDAAGEFALYESHFGKALIDTHPYPENGCKKAAICLTDGQIREELERFVTEQGLPTDLAHEYFVLTPPGVEGCFQAAGTECS